MAKRFYKRYSPLLKTDPNVRSGYRCYFARENKKGETLSTWVDVQPRYKIKDAYGNVYMFEKKRNVNKVLRKFGYKEPQGASAFYWSDDGAFEAGNLKVTKKGKAVKFLGVRKMGLGLPFGVIRTAPLFLYKNLSAKTNRQYG